MILRDRLSEIQSDLVRSDLVENRIFGAEVEFSDEEEFEGPTRFVKPLRPDRFHTLANGTELPVYVQREIPLNAALPAGFREVYEAAPVQVDVTDRRNASASNDPDAYRGADYWRGQKAQLDARALARRDRLRWRRSQPKKRVG